MIGGGGMPMVYTVWKIARETGWSLEYVEGLPVGRLHEYLQIVDAEATARSSLFNRGKG